MSGPVEAVPIRDGKPTLMQVSAFLRMLADNLDKHDEEHDNNIRAAIVVIECDDGSIEPPACLGRIFCPDHAAGILHRAAIELGKATR